MIEPLNGLVNFHSVIIINVITYVYENTQTNIELSGSCPHFVNTVSSIPIRDFFILFVNSVSRSILYNQKTLECFFSIPNQLV